MDIVTPEVANYFRLPYKPTPKQLLFHTTRAQYRLFGGAASGGKAEEISSPIFTPDGWTTIGALKRGDLVFGPDGLARAVVVAHPVERRVAYRVTFDDGCSVVCSGEHLWHTFTSSDLSALTRRDDEWRAARRAKRPSRVSGKKSKRFSDSLTARNKTTLRPPTTPPPTGAVRSTAEIMKTLLDNRGRTNHAIPVTRPLEGPVVPLPIDPYVLGVWLGDGTSSSGSITCADPEIISEVCRRGFTAHRTNQRYLYRIDGLTTLLRLTGFLGNKHVPDAYLAASRTQRMDLLRGLMDTDGHAHKRGGVEFDNTNRSIAEAVYHVAVSLGSRPGFTEGRAKLYGKDCGPRYRVKWTPDEYVFNLERKRSRQRLTTDRRTRFRYITDVVPVGRKQVRCITVDAEDGMYLTGKGLVPTHNSYALRWECYAQCLAIPKWTALLLRRTSKMLEDNHISKVRSEIPPELATYNEQDGVLTFFNGSLMRFGHLQTEAHLQGYLGSEWGLLAPDELTTTLSFKEFTFLTSRNRNVNGRPNFAAATNPGGPSHAFCKSLWIDKRPFNGWPATGYNPDDFAYIPATIYDNPHLMEANPEYETILKNLPEALRAAYLDGSWDLVAGQYFDCWNLQNNVDFSPKVESPPWCERNIGIDWGFSHNSAVEWGATDERAETLTVYRELVAPRMTPEKLGESIVALTPPSERPSIANIYLSHDAHELRKEEFSIADQLGRVLTANGLPWPQNARSSRIPGWVHMYEMLRAGQLRIHKSCTALIAAIPELQRDPDAPDDVLKIDGDDAPDALRYLIQNRWGTGNPPFEVAVGRALQALEDVHGKPKDMNQVFIRQLMAREKARGAGDKPFSLDGGRRRGAGRARAAGPWRFGR